MFREDENKTYTVLSTIYCTSMICWILDMLCYKYSNLDKYFYFEVEAAKDSTAGIQTQTQ